MLKLEKPALPATSGVPPTTLGQWAEQVVALNQTAASGAVACRSQHGSQASQRQPGLDGNDKPRLEEIYCEIFLTRLDAAGVECFEDRPIDPQRQTELRSPPEKKAPPPQLATGPLHP